MPINRTGKADADLTTDRETTPPDPENYNEQRSEAAYNTVEHFSRIFGETYDGTDPDDARAMLAQNVSDLLGDLAHMCDRHGLNLASLWERAAEHYNEETDRQGEQMDTIPTN